MRQILAIVPAGKGQEALTIADRHGGMNLVSIKGSGVDHDCDLVMMHVPNHQTEPLLGALQEIEDLKITLVPRGVITLRPPAAQAPSQVLDVSPRSPLEIFLGGLQSIGSWTGFLGYAVASGLVAWVGLYTNTLYLLTAAMLIAPYAEPAMTLALGTARGDGTLIPRSLFRYVASLATSVLVAWLLSQALSQDTATGLMVQNSLVSSVALLLPLTAGAAGAVSLCLSERNSLVTAAGPGILIAASLAPPAAVTGMASAMGEWDMVKASVFLLLLQLVGINLSGAIVFALFGLSPRGVRYERGRVWLRRLSSAVTVAGLAALLVWQFSTQPDLQRSTTAQRIAGVVKETINDSGLARVVEATARFTRAGIPDQQSLLILAYVQKGDSTRGPDEQITRQLSQLIRRAVLDAGYDVTPLVSVTMVDAP